MGASKQRFELKKLFNFDGFKIFGFWDENEHILVELERTKKTGNCPKCGKRCGYIKDRCKRRIRDLDIVNSKTMIEFEEYKIECSCGYSGVEKLSFVNKFSRFTKRFEYKVAVLCKVMTLKDVAKEMKINWTAVKRIDKEFAKRFFVDLRYLNPKRIGIDEIAYEKGHKYLTIVRDVDKNIVIWIGIGRKKETLDNFFVKLGKRKSKQIIVAVMDMWDPYIKSIIEHTKADIVFDKFHIAKKINEAVDKVRKKEFAKADDQERKKMKKKRFLILARQKRLNDSKRESLFDLLDINKKLYSAYLLKEQVLDIFDENNEYSAMKRLKRWFKNVADTGIEQFLPVIKTLKRYLYGIINYFKHRLTNAASEGFNNKINVIKRKAYGFRDLEYFMLKIFQSCGWKSST
jgi:transposase